MVTTNDDPRGTLLCCYSDEQCRINPTFQFLEELIYEVFLKLPVKSLIRFRCLSKGMRQLIDSPIFIKNHNILRLSDDEDYAIVLCQPIFDLFISVNFDKDDDDNLNLNRAKARELNSTFNPEGKVEVLRWCCNGIFCFQNSRYYVFRNPSNGTFRKVDCSACQSSHVYYSSMGYDIVNDDYKIICFISANEKRNEKRSLEIYSFRKDSWRKIPIRYSDWDWDWDFTHGIYWNTNDVCVGGIIHWLWTKRTDQSMFIGAFDLATETFTSLALPLEARQLLLQPCHFTDLQGRLCVTFFPAQSHGLHPIWVMEKYGVESSWSKLCNFGITASRIRNFYYPNMKRRLLCNFKRLSWLDPQDGSFENIKIQGLSNDYDYDAYIYVRNLLRLDQTFV